MALLIGLTLASLPVLAVLAFLLVARRRERRLAELHARQIEVTEAIHRRMGAVVAPTAREGAHGGWQLVIPVPWARPDVVAEVLDVAGETARTFDRREPVEIVLTSQHDGGRSWAA
jgi:hypothetical protein